MALDRLMVRDEWSSVSSPEIVSYIVGHWIYDPGILAMKDKTIKQRLMVETMFTTSLM